jgi:hypothetical protein
MTNPYGRDDEFPHETTTNRNKEDIPKPFYNINETYEFTLNPNDKTQQFTSTDRLIEVVRIYRAKLLRHLAPCADYTLIVEVSEPTLVREQSYRPRIHFHGTVTLKDPMKFLTEYFHLLSSCCSIQFSKLDSDYWSEYILKQKALMQPQLGKGYWLTHKDTEITPYGNPIQHIPPIPVSPPKEQALRPKESRFTSKASVRRAGVYNPEVVVSPNKLNI